MTSWSFILDFFEHTFLTYALISTLGLSIMGGLLSPLVVAKRYAFIGEGIAHSTLLSSAIALSFLSQVPAHQLFFCVFLLTLFLTALLAWTSYRQKIPSDAMIGLFLTGTLALGVIIHQTGTQKDLDLMGLLFGNILLLGPFDVALSLAAPLLVGLFLLPRLSHWLFYIFDQETAELSGLPTGLYHFGLYFLMALMVVSSIKVAGTILVNTWLIIPGVLSLRLARSKRALFTLSVSFSVASSLLGLIVANLFNLPPGATLAMTSLSLMGLILGLHYLKTKRSPSS